MRRIFLISLFSYFQLGANRPKFAWCEFGKFYESTRKWKARNRPNYSDLFSHVG